MNEDDKSGGIIEERLSRSERRIAELDALVKGLTDELLDIKAVVIKLKKEQRPPPVIQAVAPSVSRNKGISLEEEPQGKGQAEKEIPEKPQSVAKEKITLKMQPDGTLKPVKDTSEDIIIASPLDARSRTRDSDGRSSRNDLIIAEDEDLKE